jgi:spore coat-associated protein N
MQATSIKLEGKKLSSSRKRRITIVAGAVLSAVVILSATLVGSGAVFTSTSANPTNVFTAGTFTHTNSLDSKAILTLSNMKPTDSTTGSVTIQNTGSLAGDFELAMKMTEDKAGSNGGSLFGVLDLLIVVDGSYTLYEGNLKDFSTTVLGTYEPDQSHTYTFTVSFPDGGTPSSNTTGDNTFQASTTTVEFDWSAVQTADKR